MASRIILLGIVIALQATVMGCANSSNMVADGVEARVIQIYRAKQMTVGSATTRAREGHEVARLLFEVKASGDVKELKIGHDEQELIDAAGNSYKANADLSFSFGAGGGRTMTMDSSFEVPQGATLKTFRLGRASMDISGIEASKPATGSAK